MEIKILKNVIIDGLEYKPSDSPVFFDDKLAKEGNYLKRFKKVPDLIEIIIENNTKEVKEVKKEVDNKEENISDNDESTEEVID